MLALFLSGEGVSLEEPKRLVQVLTFNVNNKFNTIGPEIFRILQKGQSKVLS